MFLIEAFEITKITSRESICISEVIPFISTLRAYLSKDSQGFFGLATLKDKLKKEQTF